MTISGQEEIEMQRGYYAATASQYDAMHVCDGDEHFLALSFLLGAIDFLKIRSILDVGSGTGRAVRYIKKYRPDIRMVALEPVEELRAVGYRHGLSDADLIDGDATNLAFRDGDFDLVCEVGVLHHVKEPNLVVSEMLQVAAKAVFISDSNNFGQGSPVQRLIKQLINRLGLWDFANLLKTKGKGYTVSAGDGIAYSYSVFNNYKQIEEKCSAVHLLNTQGGRYNFYKSASHVALLGLKL